MTRTDAKRIWLASDLNVKVWMAEQQIMVAAPDPEFPGPMPDRTIEAPEFDHDPLDQHGYNPSYEPYEPGDGASSVFLALKRLAKFVCGLDGTDAFIFTMSIVALLMPIANYVIWRIIHK